ncbi:MAG: methylisocitrate lyase [Lentisphaeria bacterium]|nr:methylisocitrate lyase [Lentisphaeria bacterium]NQZ67838.1 methylisocitrate lyase [Lentisphaeria bacterium]
MAGLKESSGNGLFDALSDEQPLQIAGVVNAYSALLAEASGFKCLYLSGAGVAVSSRGMPDLGMTTMDDVLTDLRRIRQATDLPILVDVDTGWESVDETIKQMELAGASAIQLEDQISQKRCGHRPGKKLVSIDEMQTRIAEALRSRKTKMAIMARTDALASEGIDAAIERLDAYVQAGAELIFPEALSELNQYRKIADKIDVPMLANMTEFGKTPLFNKSELASAGVHMILYPLSAFRAMSAAALKVYQAIRQDGDQKCMIDIMQNREELYELINYYEFEEKIDEDFKVEGENYD